jgi:putative ABC transport system ATP-binding protein
MIAKSSAGQGQQRSIVVAKGITKTIVTGGGDLHILKGVDLELRTGELTLLMGPSGSGKTTLLSILGCILSPTTGLLEVGGQRADGLNSEQLSGLRRSRIGFVFQSYNLFPTLNATENVMLAIDVRGRDDLDSEAAAIDALKAVGLGHRIKTYPSKLSGGEKQRVAIARALAGSPAVILADEPTAALDSENGKAVMALLAEVAKDRDRVVLAVTHDHRTLAYADRIVRIEDGRMVSEERPGAAGRAVEHDDAPVPVTAEAANQNSAEGRPALGLRIRRRHNV